MSNGRKTEPFAIATFAAGVGGFILLPILFIPVGFIAGIVSYYRLKENTELKGKWLRVSGWILTCINMFYLMYEFKVGIFEP